MRKITWFAIILATGGTLVTASEEAQIQLAAK